MTEMMRAIVKAEQGPGLIEQSVPVPEPEYGQVRIRTSKTSICGTDLHIYKWDDWAQKTIPTPITIGHEFVGVIDKVGEGVHSIYPGQRVSGEGHITCGVCRNCREGKRHFCANTVGLGIQTDGCFAEYFCIPARNVFVLPEDIPDAVAAIMDPFGNAVHTVLSSPVVADDVLITGSGPIGLMAAMVAKVAGARSVTITDINPTRLDLAQEVGVTNALNVAKLPLESFLGQIHVPDGFGVGLEMSGHSGALSSMIQTMRHGGNIALLGIIPDQSGINWTDLIFRSLTLRGIYGRKIFRTWYQMVGLIQGGLDLGHIITHRYAAQDWARGFDTMLEGSCGKVILDWS
jgi:threonine 3-dehydrogenase